MLLLPLGSIHLQFHARPFERRRVVSARLLHCFDKRAKDISGWMFWIDIDKN
jgi:hypothetical protein